MDGLREKIAEIIRLAEIDVHDPGGEYQESSILDPLFVAEAILAIPEIDPTPLDQRILAALGGLRDDMLPGDVGAVQRFAERMRVRPSLGHSISTNTAK